jgi:glycosyltransferase involved in cell wall biosynthesis
MKICIIAHFAYGALSGGETGHIGGVERQTTLLASWLVNRGHDVSMVTWDEGQPDGIVWNGVRVYKTCRGDEGIPGIRFLTPRWASLNAALRRADAQVHYQNCGEYVTGQVALWSRIHRRKFVYSVASDPDCMTDLPLMKTVRERILYRYGLRNADRVIVQTRNQQRMLSGGFGIESRIIPMPCPGPGQEDYIPPVPPANGSGRILWVGRIDRVKRPDRFLDVVEACPELAFDLVGPAGGDPYARGILERAARCPNLRIHGGVPRDDVPTYYRKAACLCSTSDVEGFPNTFLEAWSYGIPVVSTIDPDGLILEKGLGIVARDVPQLVAALRGMMASPKRWAGTSTQARAYFLDTHHISRVMPRMERLFLEFSSSQPAN